jgi:hypothetical protein
MNQMHFLLRLGLLTTFAAAALSAQVTYQQTTKFKGGALIEMTQKMASMPMMGRMMGGMKQAFEDQTAEVFIKGNKMARIGPKVSTLYDLDAGTITTILHDKQSYTTETFEEMTARMEEMQKRMNRKQQGGEMQFDVKVDQTGKTQKIEGETAKETVVTLTAKQATEQGQMVVTTHAWMVPMTPLQREVQAFHKRLAEKLAGGMSGMSPMMGSTGSGIAAAMREMSKMEGGGYPVVSEVVVSGLTGAGGPMAGMAAMNGGGNVDPNTPMMDMETSNHGFVKGVADDSKFTVPASYKEETRRKR